MEKFNGDVSLAQTWTVSCYFTDTPSAADPELTQLGISQASHAHDAWKEELAFRIPLPDKMYCSPLTRAIKTNEITFRGIIPERERSVRKAVVVEVGSRRSQDQNMYSTSSLPALSRAQWRSHLWQTQKPLIYQGDVPLA